MMKKRNLAAALLGVSLSAAFSILSYGAQGTWQDTGSGWGYIREDGQAAVDSWEDIDGEWYHFDSSGHMQTGWQTVGNLRYYFEPDGKLSHGWQHDTENGNDDWYFYDWSGNAVIRWLYDEGKWYWFNGNGTLSTASTKTIDGQKYYFHEDGSLRANEYEGFKYFNSDGVLDSEGDVIGWNEKHKKMKVEEGTREEIADELNTLPKNWLEKFIKSGWTFIYCPSDDYYSSTKTEDGDRYYIRYKLNQSDKILRFTDTEAIKRGFGEYIYLIAKKQFRELEFSEWVEGFNSELLSFTELPEHYYQDYGVICGVLLEKYLDEADSARMQDELEEIWSVFDQVVQTVPEE